MKPIEIQFDDMNICAKCLHPFREHDNGFECGSSINTDLETYGGMDWCTCKGFVPHPIWGKKK